MKSYHTEHSMSTVMQCVQELKAWQESEQQKLCENSNINTLKNEMEEVLKSFDIPKNVQGKNFKYRNHSDIHIFLQFHAW